MSVKNKIVIISSFVLFAVVLILYYYNGKLNKELSDNGSLESVDSNVLNDRVISSSPDNKANLTLYKNSNNNTKVEWAVEMPDVNVLYQTSYEVGDRIPLLDIGDLNHSWRHSVVSGVSFSGNRSYRLLDNSNGKGDYYNYPNTSSDYHLSDYGIYKFPNGTPLSVTFKAKSIGNGFIEPLGDGGWAKTIVNLKNKVVRNAKIGDTKIYLDSVSGLYDGSWITSDSISEKVEDLYLVLKVNEKEKSITLNYGLENEYFSGQNLRTRPWRDAFVFGERRMSNTDWTNYSINTFVTDFDDYDVNVSGGRFLVATGTDGELYIDDLKMGYATLVDLYRDGNLKYSGYLSDFDDIEAIDKNEPNKVSNIKHKIVNNKVQISIDNVIDNGTTYNYKLDAKDKNNKVTSSVSSSSIDIVSGLKGYSYEVSKIPGKFPDNIVDIKASNGGITDFNLGIDKSYGDFYLNIKAIDNAGNLSETFTYFVDITNPNIDIKAVAPDNSNKTVMLEYVASDLGSGIKNITLPDGSKTTEIVGTYKVSSNGDYTFIVEDEANNMTTKLYEVKDIDSLINSLRSKLTVTPNNSENYMYLIWTAPLDSQRYSYKIYKKYKDEISKVVASELSFDDKSGKDLNGPKKPNILNYNISSDYIDLNYSSVEDVGTEYTYKIEAEGIDYGNILYSNEETKEIKTDLKGYSILIDAKKDSVPDNEIETKLTNYRVAHTSKNDYYIHIAGIDNAGNIGEVEHLFIDVTPPELLLTVDSKDITKDPVTINVKASDKGSGIDYILLPDSKKVYSETVTFNVDYNGTYLFKVYDKFGNFVEKDIVIDFINNKPELKVNLKDIYNGDVLKNQNALYSDMPSYSTLKLKAEVFDKDIKPTNDKLKIEYSIYDENLKVIESKIILENYEASGKWDNPFGGYFDIDVSKYKEGFYKIKVKVTDSLLEYSEDTLMFLVDTTSPLGSLTISDVYKYGVDIGIKDLKDDISGLDESTFEFLEAKNNSKIFNTVSGSYDLLDGLKVRLDSNLESNTKYSYKMRIKDKVGHIYESNLIEYVSSINLVEKEYYYSKDIPNTLNIEWTNSLNKSDGLFIEIYRNGSLVSIVDSGNEFIDSELDYEKLYSYEFIVVGKDANGNRIESIKTQATYKTGSPILIVNGNNKIYKTLFSDYVKSKFTVEFNQGGSVLVGYEDLKGKYTDIFNLTPKIQNILEFDLSGSKWQVIPFTFRLEGNNVLATVTKSVTVEEVSPVVRDISPEDYIKKYKK